MNKNLDGANVPLITLKKAKTIQILCQICLIKLESFGYTDEQLTFTWANTSHINPNISLAQFSVKARMFSEVIASLYPFLYIESNVGLSYFTTWRC